MSLWRCDTVTSRRETKVGSGDDKLYAFDAAGGMNCSGTPTTRTPLWTGATGGPISSSPAVANGVVYVGSEDNHLEPDDVPRG